MDYQIEYNWGSSMSPWEFDEKINEFNKTHSVELRTWFSLRMMTIYVDAWSKNAIDDKWVMIGSCYMKPIITGPNVPKNHVDLKQLTDKNRCEIEPFVPVIEQYLN